MESITLIDTEQANRKRKVVIACLQQLPSEHIRRAVFGIGIVFAEGGQSWTAF